MISWIRNSNRPASAARTLVDIFDVVFQILDNEKCSNLWFSRQREHTTAHIFYISFYSVPTGPFVTRFVNTIEWAQEKIIVK